MYTECPECGIAFRVTAKVLQQANGNVRCGGCNHAFNSLEYLSEEMPGSIPADDSDVSDDALAETSRRLLKTLDELAGTSEVRIEDTGVEWRSLAENLDGDYVDDIEASDEMRYDDNSPLPDEFDEVEVFAEEAEPQPVESTDTGLHIEFTESQGEAVLTEPDEWTDLLDEVCEPKTEETPIEELESEVLQIEAELAAIHTQLLSKNDEQDDTKDDDGPADIDTQFNMEAVALGLETTGTTKALADDVPLVDESPSIDTEEEESDAEDTPDVLDEDDGSELGEEISAEADTEDEEIETADADHDDEFEEENDYGDADDVDDDTPGDAEDEASAEAEERSDVDTADVDDENESLAARNESTSEFEAQIDVAASALAGIDAAENEAAEEGDAVSEYGADSNDISLDFLALENQVTDDEDLEKQVDATADESDADEQTGESKHFVPKPTEEEMTALALQDDEFSATLVGMATPEDLLKGKAADVETIIMEGEFVRNVVEQERIDSEAAARNQFGDAGSLSDTYALRRNKLPGGRRNYDPPKYARIAGVAVLGLVLLAQFVHYSREALATSGYFNQTIGPVYQLLGSPVNPEWDITGWQFETTNGNIGETDNSLVIVSRLINQSDTELPYPLVHVSLTDRWEDIMGSRVLEPGEYLAGALDRSTPVPPGQTFTAVITIENPATEATGFKLNVCYRQEPGVVRCAIEDFK